MQITGKHLALVIEAIKGAIADTHYHAASCPDVIEYEDRLDELEIQQRKYQRLLDRCTKDLTMRRTKMKVLFRLNANNQYLAFFFKNGELTQYSANQETSCSAGFFQRTLHLTDLHRVSPAFRDFISEVSQAYGFLEIKHSLEKLKEANP